MPQYRWVGLDLQGHVQKGQQFAQSLDFLEKLLLEKEIALLDARPARRWLTKKWNAAYTASFFKQLSLLLDAGVFVTDALELLAKQSDNELVKKIIDQIIVDLHNGISLSAALEKHPDCFSSLHIVMIKAGEESGSLIQALELISVHLENRISFYQKIRACVLTPAITFIFFILILSIIFTVIVPKLVVLFVQMGKPMPQSTRTILAVSSFITNRWFLFFVFSITGMVTAIVHAIPERVKKLKDRLVLRIPIISDLMINKSIVYFLESTALLLQGGVSLVPALHTATGSIDNVELQEHGAHVVQEVASGQSLAVAMSKQPLFIFPADLIAMVRIGEESGKLTMLIRRAASLYKSKVNRSLTLFSTLLQPLLVIFLGLCIAILMIAIYVPIFELPSVIDI
jgi:type II secretory pathway component PulF